MTQVWLLPLALEMKLMEKSDGVTQIDTIFLNVKRLTFAFGGFFLIGWKLELLQKWLVCFYLLYIVCFNFFFAGARTTDSFKIIHNHQMVCRLFGRYRHFNSFSTRVIVPTTVRKGLWKVHLSVFGSFSRFYGSMTNTPIGFWKVAHRSNCAVTFWTSDYIGLNWHRDCVQ